MNANGKEDHDKEIQSALSQDANEIADAITGYFQEMGNYQTRGFALFVVDYDTGNISYISDIKHDDAVAMLGMWVAREIK